MQTPETAGEPAAEKPFVMLISTYKSVETILVTTGAQSFPVNRSRAREIGYCVVTRNAHKYDPEGEEPHGSAFMIGKIKAIVPPKDPKVKAAEAAPDFKGRRRSLIQFSEYAVIKPVLNVWQEHGGRYSVQYRPMDAMPIDFDKLEWKPMPSNMELAAWGAMPSIDVADTHDEAEGTEEAPDSLTTNLPALLRAPDPAEVSLGGYAHFIQQAKAEAAAALAAKIGVAPESIHIEVRL